MLAIKNVLSDKDNIGTLIFDEIDTGVSGQVADAIGDRLKKLSEKLQVFVITHLPQVASKGNFHLKVQKEYNENKSTWDIETGTKRDIDEMVCELEKNVFNKKICKRNAF